MTRLAERGRVRAHAVRLPRPSGEDATGEGRVGHERDDATAEVRRLFQGGYEPLYQGAYLLGGLQVRALRREIVDTTQMPQNAFHAEILRQGNMPIALLRLALSKQKLTGDTPVDWTFYGEIPNR